MTDTNIIKAVREALGFTQLDLAAFLQLNRSQIALSETGRRNLPPDKMLKIIEIFNALQAASVAKSGVRTAEDLSQENRHSQPHIAQKLNDLQFKASKIRQQLKKNSPDPSGPSTDSSRAVPPLLHPSSFPEGLFDAEWQSIILSNQRKKEEKNTNSKHLDLQLELVGIEAKIRYLEETIILR